MSSNSQEQSQQLKEENDDISETVSKKQRLNEDNQDKNNANGVKKQENVGEKDEKLIKKRKYALLIGYSGSGYFGLQRNPSNKEFRTIEDEIVEALVKVNAIPQAHADEMFKMSFQRAARTDKGVSAAANLLSLKMELSDDTISRVNEIIPKQIKIFANRKVTQSFDAKKNCDARTYMYMLPTFAFCPVEELLTEEYRASEETMKYVNRVLKKYVGTHNFHNFTSGKKFIDPSAKRYIISMECGKPFVKENLEFAVITVKGQSFMLHQIRKMIGLAIAIVRGYASEETMENCWTGDKIDFPTAPALGLMLDQLHYDKYNRKFGKDGIHQPLIWSECEQDIEKFKHEHIYPNVVNREIKDKSMFRWLSNLSWHHYGKLIPNYPPGYYTGMGRAAYNLQLLNGGNPNCKIYDDDDDDEGKNDGDE